MPLFLWIHIFLRKSESDTLRITNRIYDNYYNESDMNIDSLKESVVLYFVFGMDIR